MNTIEVNEVMLKALLRLLFIKNGCLTIAENLNEETACYVEGCAKDECSFYNVENLIKYLTGEWDEEHDYD